MQNALKFDVFQENPKAQASCPVCGSQAPSFDEVAPMESRDSPRGGQEVMQLAECRHCDHRWTWRNRSGARRLGLVADESLSSPRRVPGLRGVASAA